MLRKQINHAHLYVGGGRLFNQCLGGDRLLPKGQHLFREMTSLQQELTDLQVT